MSKEFTALVISDLHLRPAHADIAEVVLKKAEEELEKHDPEYLIIGGDTFHTKNIVYASMLTLFGDFLKRVTQKRKVIVLVGNHDWAILYSVHSLQTFKMPNLKIVETTYKINEKVGFIGYCREKERFEELMDNLKSCEIIFGHLDLNGFELGSGWEESDSFCGAERFTSFKKVFSGHFHKSQERTFSSGTEIVYVGTGYTTDFNESDQEKRFLLVDLNTGEWTGIPTNLTLHKTIKITVKDELPELPEEELKRGVNYRIIVSGTKEEIASFKTKVGYQAKIMYDIKNSEVSRLDINASDNQEVMINKYVDFEIKRLYGDEKRSNIDHEKLMKLGKSLLARANGGK